MSALAAPALPEADAGSPLPWRRMIWVTWRQHRLALAGVAALLGALAVCLSLVGLQLHHAYATAPGPADPVLPWPVRPAGRRVRGLDAGRPRGRGAGRLARPPRRYRDRGHPGQWWTKGGNFAFAGRPSMALLSQFCSAPPAGPGGPKPSLETFAQCLTQHGYTEWTSYQPAGRFWAFQWIEGGWLLALSLLLISVTAWLVRQRAA
ncbi:MAG: hypothetical protein ACRDOI_36270 [Trebonia sp.]